MRHNAAIVDENLNVIVDPTLGGRNGFVAHVEGNIPWERVDATTAMRLRKLVGRFQILVLRDQAINPAAQLRLTRLLGEPESGLAGRPTSHQVDGYHGVLRLHNRPGSPTLEYGQSWHSDGLAYARVPHGITMLSCKACPDGVGDTLFASQVLAHALMPETLRDAIADLQWMLPPMPYSEVPKQKLLVQPMVRFHEVTGNPFVFCAPNAKQILGFSEADSIPILAQIRHYQLLPECHYRHKWRPNDLVIWENCGLLHNRCDIVEHNTHGLRELHRTATAGSHAATEID